MKSTKCHECWGSDGRHASYCRSRGYAAVGPHPDAPQAEPAKLKDTTTCCGGTRMREGCEYHDPALQPAPATERTYEVFDAAPGIVVYDATRMYVHRSGCVFLLPGEVDQIEVKGRVWP